MAAQETFEIKRAERKQARLRLAVSAASGGGKTWTALELAFGIMEELIARGILQGTLEGKVGVIDTERRSAHLYAHLGPYDVVELGPPHSVERYVGAMQALERAGVQVIILDSISHAWMGQGGVLALLDRFEARERFSAFGSTVNPAQDEFVDAMLRSPCHVIATMRSKTAWVIEEQQRGGRTVHAPRRIGMAPIQRPGIEFEFTTLLDLDTTNHHATVIKNRCPVFKDWQPKKLTREHGRALAAWLLEGAPEPTEPLTGTPFERAQATLAAVVRAMHRAANLPDLQRVYVDGVKSLRAFADTVERDQVKDVAALEAKLANEKDLRKAALGAPSERTGAVVDPGAAIDLEQMLQDIGIPHERCLEQFGVPRLVLLPEDKLQAVVDWITGEALELGAPTPALSKRLRDCGAHVPVLGRSNVERFADMPDDLPWKD